MTDTTKRPLVTFAVIVYNQESFIREAIEGAFTHTYEMMEIILSDDYSYDRIYQSMRKVAADYIGPHTIVLNRNKPNLGLVPHIARLRELVRGDFIVLNAGDDVSLLERSSAMVAVCQIAKGDVTLVHPPAKKIDENSFSLGLRLFPQPFIDPPSAYTLAAGCDDVLEATVGWDRHAYERLYPLDTGLDADNHMIPSWAVSLGRVEQMEKPLVKHRAGSVSGVCTAHGLPMTTFVASRAGCGSGIAG